MESKLLNRKKVAELAQVNPATVRDWEKKGKIEVACKINGRPLYSKESVDKLFATTQ
jgi:predicted site-specific integrase-resolvase